MAIRPNYITGYEPDETPMDRRIAKLKKEGTGNKRATPPAVSAKKKSPRFPADTFTRRMAKRRMPPVGSVKNPGAEDDQGPRISSFNNRQKRMLSSYSRRR